MDSNFPLYHENKLKQLKRGKQHHIQYVNNPQTRMACREMYEEIVEYLTQRYPKCFRKNSEKTTLDGELLGERNVVENLITGEVFPLPAETERRALEYAGLLVQDDLILMVKNSGLSLPSLPSPTLLTTNRRILPPRCRLRNPHWVLAPARKIPHLIR